MLRPVFLLGNGLRQNPALVEELCALGVPALTTWQACDIIPEDSPVFCGRPGTLGQRAANIIQQKADFFAAIGARLDMEQVGHNLDGFVPRAIKIVIDVDDSELAKFPASWHRFKLDLCAPWDNRYGGRLLPLVSGGGSEEWLAWCKALYARFRPELDGCAEGETVDPYYFVSRLSDAAPNDAVIVPGSSGMQSCAMMQAFKVKRGQRVLLCNTIGAMGMEPMAIGAAECSKKPVIVVTGDGGFAQNVQDLETVRREKLDIKYFVFSNGGYGSIATMQDTRFGLRVGSDPCSGFTLPDLHKIAMAFGLGYACLENGADCRYLDTLLGVPGAAIIEVKTSMDFRYACKVASSMQGNVLTPDSMENMTPHLPTDELAEIMRE